MCLSAVWKSVLAAVDNLRLIPRNKSLPLNFRISVGNTSVFLSKPYTYPHLNLDFPQGLWFLFEYPLVL